MTGTAVQSQLPYPKPHADHWLPSLDRCQALFGAWNDLCAEHLNVAVGFDNAKNVDVSDTTTKKRLPYSVTRAEPEPAELNIGFKSLGVVNRVTPDSGKPTLEAERRFENPDRSGREPARRAVRARTLQDAPAMAALFPPLARPVRRTVTHLTLAALSLLPTSLAGARTLPTTPSAIPEPSGQYGLPFAAPPGPDTWLLGQFYGNTTFAYQQRATQYQYGQGLHFGLDFTAACGTPIVAITDGVVSEVDGPHGSPPHNLVIDHPDGLSSLYGHLLRKASVKVGQRVRRGEVVAVSGDSQLSCVSEPHLHLEIRDHSHLRLFNPVLYLKADWAALSLVDPDVNGRAFEQNLDHPGAWQFLDDQPAVHIGGALLNAYPRAWPPLAPATPALATPKLTTPTVAGQR